jgi:hypothetical protein
MVVLVEPTKAKLVGASKMVYPGTLEDATELPPAFVATNDNALKEVPLGNPVIV